MLTLLTNLHDSDATDNDVQHDRRLSRGRDDGNVTIIVEDVALQNRHKIAAAKLRAGSSSAWSKLASKQEVPGRPIYDVTKLVLRIPCEDEIIAR